ncbi:hypothetical protein SAMN04488104_1001153 [Algoriphagus faecimaris]|uniref:Uncharacterized protein n=1 Tax=Algoriphagus faecimaris TaxID=686796 RepID=A0A1G6MFK5_9BACT|nr:hypothetical protein [Algoriphagus faecimaris]SDC54057.1 hypothetical protein SAMN04488104_1001153 [Algoriphagus faecimaris]
MKTTIKNIRKPFILRIFIFVLFLNFGGGANGFRYLSGSTVYAQTSLPGGPETCYGNCRIDPEGDCYINTVDPNGTPIIGICIGMSRDFGLGG